MTGRTHRAIAATGATTTWAIGDLTLLVGGTVLTGAVLAASGPDRIEQLAGTRDANAKDIARGHKPGSQVARLPHRRESHWLPTALLPALLALLASHYVLTLRVPVERAERLPEHLNAWWTAAPWALAGGVLLGWWLHSLADACTDRGCWLWRRHRQVLLPDGWRIKVYEVTTTRHWLTGKHTTSKRPSRGERRWRHAAVLVTCAIVALQALTLNQTEVRAALGLIG